MILHAGQIYLQLKIWSFEQKIYGEKNCRFKSVSECDKSEASSQEPAVTGGVFDEYMLILKKYLR